MPMVAVEATLTGVASGGRRGVESGAFWLGTRAATSSIDAVVALAGRGVVEAAGLWEVSPEVFGVVSRWAGERGFVLLGTAHTHGHGVPARLSGLDRRHLVRAPDVLAVVLGEAGQERNPSRWSWNVCVNGAFVVLEGKEFRRRIIFSDDSVVVARASADGVETWDGRDG
jgi:hypothetical protein